MISVPVAIALLYVVLRDMHPRTEVVAAYVVAWLLLLSGLRTAIGHLSAPTPPTPRTCAA